MMVRLTTYSLGGTWGRACSNVVAARARLGARDRLIHAATPARPIPAEIPWATRVASLEEETFQ